MAQGMFDALNSAYRNQRQEELDEQSELRFQAQSPAQARAMAVYEGGAMAGRGLGQAAAGIAGRDPRSRTERNIESLEKAKAAMAELGEPDMTNPAGVDAYYKGVIDILRKHNLPAEAHAAAQEWNEYKNKTADRKLKEDELTRKKDADAVKAADLKRKNELTAERNQQLAARGMPEFVQIIDRIEKETDPATKEMLTKHANALIESKKKGVVLENAGDRVIVRDKATGAVLGTDVKGMEPLKPKDAAKEKAGKEADATAYRSDMQGLQTVYKAAADFYNSPGLDDLIGKWTGIAAETGPEKGGAMREAFLARLSPAGQEALGLFQQVQGASFLKALKDLKAAGKGSTGLGAVSEIEGNKIQAANGALFPRQQPASFRRKLADFIDTIEASANNLAVKAEENGIPPIHLSTIQLTGPVRGKAAPDAPTRPRAPAQQSKPTVDPDRVRVMHPDGVQTGTIPRAKLEAYKAKGYKELK
jgi:hypothetical protein